MAIIRQAVSRIRKFLIAIIQFTLSDGFWFFRVIVILTSLFLYGNPSWNLQWNLAREILGWRGGGSVGGCLVLRGRQEVPKISSERLARIDSVSRHFDFLEFLSWYHSKNTRTYIDWYQQPRTGILFNTKYCLVISRPVIYWNEDHYEVLYGLV